MVWWVNTDKEPGTPQVALLLSLLSRTGVENAMKEARGLR